MSKENIEKNVRAILSNVIDIPGFKVDNDSTISTLGGDSLSGIDVEHRLEEFFDINLEGKININTTFYEICQVIRDLT